MKIGICPSKGKSEALDFIAPIARFLKDHGAEVFIDGDYKDHFPIPEIGPETPLDVIITLGGDGTLLFYRKKYAYLKQTVFTAVNLGGLGFMADVPVNEIETYLGDLLRGKYAIEERLMLEGQMPSGNHLYAVNDFVFHRGSIPNMILLKVTINHDHFNTFQADGLILSTPTGSSAYSLACGGPLMHPKLHAFVLTTISAHTLTNRPFVLPEDSIIKVEYIADRKEPIDVTIDGIETKPLFPGQSVTLMASSGKFRIIHYTRHNFYEIVRLKLHWKGKSSI